jgi:addiction module RelB/DinJ family antitoxin
MQGGVIIMSNKTASLLIRVEPDLKREVEAILDNLGITMSSAINIFLKQIAIKKSFPIPIDMLGKSDTCLLSRKELMEEIAVGLQDIKEGRYEEASSFFSHFEEEHMQ